MKSNKTKLRVVLNPHDKKYRIQRYTLLSVDMDLPPRHPDHETWGWKDTDLICTYNQNEAIKACSEEFEKTKPIIVIKVFE